MSGSINSIVNTAASGLAATQAGISVLGDNVANAGVAGYTNKTLDVSTFQVGAESIGVRTGQITRSVNAAVQASLFAANSDVGARTVTSQALSAVNATQGVPGDGTSLADGLTALQNSFTALLAQPSSASQQSAIVSAASTLATTINTTANAITAQRNTAQAQIVATVATINSALSTVNQTTQQIMTATTAGTDTATLEDQRDAALTTLSGALNLTYDEQPGGNIALLGPNGLSIPLDSTFSSASATLSPSSSAVPPILLQSSNPAIPAQNVTSLLSGGTLGALVTLRDTTLPTYTAQLDEFSQQMSSRLDKQGLALFTNASGTVPDGTTTPVPTSYAGYSSQIQVNPLVLATPSLVRDGTPSANTSGAAGFSTVISQVLNYGFGADSSGAGTPNTAFGTTGLGPSGNLTSSISATPDLASYAQAFVAGQSTDTAQAATNLTNATNYQTTMTSQFSSQSGVDVDQQMGLMIQLQNSYQANARILQTVQAMFLSLVTAISTT